jgi:hypothetical protein
MLRILQLRATSAWVLSIGLALGACGFGDDVSVATPTSDFGGAGVFASAAGSGGLPCDTGTGGRVSEMLAASPQLDAPLVKADTPPPPISGGTLLVSKDGTKLVAADPDRDAIYVIDVATRSLERRLALNAGDEPGRLVQDAAGRIHVALRGGRGLATFALGAPTEPRRSEICDLPRGLAYDAKRDRLYVACAEGKVVRVDPATGVPQLKLELGRDLRDVVSRESGLFVTRFRSAEAVQLDPDSGATIEVRTPPDSTRAEFDSDPFSTCGGKSSPPLTARAVQSSADVAWRTVDVPGRGLAMLHQRAQAGQIRTTPGGYGGGDSCGHGIVRSAVTTIGADAFRDQSLNLSTAGLLVDIAVDPTGSMIAVANAAGWGTPASVHLFDMPLPDVQINGTIDACTSVVGSLPADGQVTAVAFVTARLLVAQTREPAGIVFYDFADTGWPSAIAQTLDLKQPSRNDSGHTMFHVTAGAGIACASCHPEAGDDGHTWTFSGIGARRTQSLRGGILGTEPFHWNGEMRDFAMLVNEVFVKRMNGPVPDAERGSLLAQWIDKQPALSATSPDAMAVERGKTLFESEELACVTCHTGDHLTNNKAAFVGTGAVLQVPSLIGVSFRAPFMHDGCATTLADRFGPCGGGEQHGHTSQLTAEQKLDVTAYLESL